MIVESVSPKQRFSWLLETKSTQSAEVAFKGDASENRSENATALTDTTWRYRKASQSDFQSLSPARSQISRPWYNFSSLGR
jgi:hypothetical protein